MTSTIFSGTALVFSLMKGRLQFMCLLVYVCSFLWLCSGVDGITVLLSSTIHWSRTEMLLPSSDTSFFLSVPFKCLRKHDSALLFSADCLQTVLPKPHFFLCRVAQVKSLHPSWLPMLRSFWSFLQSGKRWKSTEFCSIVADASSHHQDYVITSQCKI